MIAHLDDCERDPAPLAALVATFEANNPGYRIRWASAGAFSEPTESAQVLFIQGSPFRASVDGQASDLTCGDIVVLRAGQSFEAEATDRVLAFGVPDAPPEDLPTFLRPDHDPLIHNEPGGCAEESDAYRRVLITWSKAHGPYTWRSINAHRVRMTDSLSHYHPEVGGFDELYLVQDAPPGARLYTSPDATRLEDPDALQREDLAELVQEIPLRRGDFVYQQRGVMHRATGGVLAQVITAPGFIPGREIPLDHHLEALNRRFDLRGQDALPHRRLV